MKKFIYLIIGCLLTYNSFSQVHTEFDNMSIVEFSNIDIKKDIANNDLNNNTNFYGFTNNDTLYVLSYRTNDEKNWKVKEINEWHQTRDLLLYRKDYNGWVIASNIIQNDYRFSIIENDYETHKTYNTHNYNILLPYGVDFGVVMKLKNGCVFMILTNIYANYKDNNEYKYISYLFLVPNNDGTYNATRFEPLNKKTIIETSGTNISTKNNNEIEIIYYYNKITLNFVIENKTIFYNGNIKLTQTNDKSNTIYSNSR